MTYSRGFMKEMLILNFCSSIMKVSKMQESKDDDTIVSMTANKHYKTHAKINSRIDKLIGMIDDSFHELMNEEMFLYAKKNMTSKITKVLKLSESAADKNKISLEMLGVFIMFSNFCERSSDLGKKKVKLDERLEIFNIPKFYIEIIDLMNSADIGFVEEDMFLASGEIVNIIKG